MKLKLPSICLMITLCLTVSNVCGCNPLPGDTLLNTAPTQAIESSAPSTSPSEQAESTVVIQTQQIVFPVNEEDHYIRFSLIEDYGEYGDRAEPAIYVEIYREYDGATFRQTAFAREEGAVKPCMYVARLTGEALPEMIVLGETDGSGGNVLCKVFRLEGEEIVELMGGLSAGIPSAMLPNEAYASGEDTLAYQQINVIGKTGLSCIGDDGNVRLLALLNAHDEKLWVELVYENGAWVCSNLRPANDERT